MRLKDVDPGLFDRIMGHWARHCGANNVSIAAVNLLGPWDRRKKLMPTSPVPSSPLIFTKWNPTPMRSVSDADRVAIYKMYLDGGTLKSVGKHFSRCDKTVSVIVKDFMEGRCELPHGYK